MTANGSDSGAGTQASPLSLTKALSSSSPARAGDTIWLRGGTYNSSYTSNLNGTASAPIVVRAYPGERVILNANNSAARSADVVLSIFGSHTYFWGFEIMSTDPFRPTTDGAHGPNGIYVNTSTNIKLINLIIHDLPGQGVGMWTENTGAEMYGCLVYNVGSNHWDHGIYVQNQTGTKKIADNIVVNAASHGFHAYGSSEAFLNNITLDGNTIYESGILGGSPERNILLGGLVVAQNPVVTNNYTYFRGTSGGNSNIGYSAGASNAQVKDNVWVGGNASVRMMFNGGHRHRKLVHRPARSGRHDVALAVEHGLGVAADDRQSDLRAEEHVRAGPRAHHDLQLGEGRAPSRVPLAQAGLNVGDAFEIRDAMNYFGAPVATGTYDGSSSISIPMNNLQPAAPLGSGLTYPVHTAPQFGAFVLVRTSAGSGGRLAVAAARATRRRRR